jgi:hypothetical protein
MKRCVRTWILAAPIVAAAGCMGIPELVERTWVPPFEHASIGKVAVLEFDDRTGSTCAGRDVADAVEELLVTESPYTVVSRMDLMSVIKDHGILHDGWIAPERLRHVACAAGVDALVLGSVDVYRFEESQIRPLKAVRTAAVEFRIKIVNATTTQVLWSRTVRGSHVWRGWLDRPNAPARRECLRRAVATCTDELRVMFPHARNVRPTRRASR